MAALEASGALDETATAPTPATDDMGRPLVETAAHVRGYWNIRDASGDDPQHARNLAEWACRKHQEAEDAIAAVVDAADAQVAQVRAWQTAQVAKHERKAEWFVGVLDLYQQDFAPEDKTTKLVAGQIVRRAMPPCKSTDEAAALQWALAQEDVDALAPRKLSLSSVNKRLSKQADGSYVDADTGETVEFMREVPNPVPYSLAVKHSGA
jgi:hypothetical protein